MMTKYLKGFACTLIKNAKEELGTGLRRCDGLFF
jgi:hypothetical protein